MGAARRFAFIGEKLKIAFARNRDGAYPAEEFFDQLPQSDKAKLMKLFEILGDHGNHSNPEKFGDLQDGLYEFKSFQIRMPFTYVKSEKGTVIVTHGFTKKSPKAPKAEIQRAWAIIKDDSAASNVCAINEKNAKRKRQ